MMHDIARPMKDPLQHRRPLPMKNFFGMVGLKCQTCPTIHIFNHDEAYTKSFTDDDIAEMRSSHTKQKGYFECCMYENQGGFPDDLDFRISGFPYFWVSTFLVYV